MQYKVSGSWPLNHNAILSIASTTGFAPSLPSGSTMDESREVREPARGGARVTGTREKRESLGTGSLRTRSAPLACAGTLSVFHRRTATRALATSELIPTNFRSRLPAISGAQSDSQRPCPRPWSACPVSIHSIRRLGQPFGEPPASAPLCRPRGGWAREWQSRDTKQGMDRTASVSASETPAHPSPQGG